MNKRKYNALTLPGPIDHSNSNNADTNSDQYNSKLHSKAYVTMNKQLIRRKHQIVSYFYMKPWLEMCQDLNLEILEIVLPTNSDNYSISIPSPTADATKHDELIHLISEHDDLFQYFLYFYKLNGYSFVKETKMDSNHESHQRISDGADSCSMQNQHFTMCMHDVMKSNKVVIPRCIVIIDQMSYTTNPCSMLLKLLDPTGCMIAFTYLEPNPVNSESNSNMSALYSMDATEPNRNPENSHFNNVIDNSIFEQPVTIEDEENQHPVFHDHPLESEHAHVKTTPNVYDKAAMLHIGSVLILENIATYIHKETSGRWSKYLCIANENIVNVYN